jgi:FKBP-type peptidyl-prolyl cis-trans isomerase 2
MNLNMKTLLPLSVLLAAALAGCTSGGARSVANGDRVGMQFTCRLPNGELAVSTDPDTVKGAPVSRIYMKRTISDPLEVVVGGEKKNQPTPTRIAFETDVAERLAIALVGAKDGATLTTELSADRIAGLPENERFLKMAKVRKRPKEQRMTREAYKARTGLDPAVDQSFVNDPALPGKVVEVNGDEVLIRFTQALQEIELPFGRGIIRERTDRFEIDIQAIPGTLVRTGGMVGRVATVDNEMITIDYGHPFGGEKLNCDVTVASLKSAEKKEPVPAACEKNDGVPVPAPPASSGNTLDPQAEKVFDAGMAKMLALSGQSAGTAEAARSGDLVTTNYTVTLEDGTLVATTLKNIAGDQAVKKVSWYREPSEYAPQELVAGKQEVMPGLGEALVGMKGAEMRRLILPPDKAFGMIDPQKTQLLPCSQTFPRTVRMPADEYVKRFSALPILDKEVELLPYFKSRVVEVTERDVALEFVVADGASFSDGFGSVVVSVTGDRITTTLKPQLGAPFPLKEGVGIISATDGMTFTVDFNHPLAGKTIVLELEAVLVAAAAAQAGTVEWIDDYDAGLARAKKEGKPVFLILHADWCDWCKKTFSETIPDPRIMTLKDRFIWVRINSDKELKYKQQYGQEGFPMMVLLSADGTVLKKIDGYRDARVLREEIKAVLN